MAPTPTTYPVGPLATQVYFPAPTGRPHAFIYNAGPSTVYVGGGAGVTPQNGLPISAKDELDFSFTPTGIWAVCGGLTLSGTITTTTTAAITHGASTTVNVTAITNFAAGQTVQVGAGTAAETLKIASTSTAPSITFTTKPVYDHVSGAAVTVVTGGAAVSVRTVAGTT